MTTYRIHRGGDWFRGRDSYTAQFRNRTTPHVQAFTLGFRILCTSVSPCANFPSPSSR